MLRSDGGGEYFSDEFNDYLKDLGIQRKYSCRSTSQQNGIAKRKNMSIKEVARAMLNEKKMLDYFWVEVVATTLYIMNRTSSVLVHVMIAQENYTGRKLDILHLKIFSCIDYVHVPDERRTRLDPKAKNATSLGIPYS